MLLFLFEQEVILDKENNIAVFQDTAKRCKTDPVLINMINRSRHTQLCIKSGQDIIIPLERYSEPANIIISSKRTFEAARQYNHCAVLNFANAHTPGGGVAYGARAQEEALCRVSTLYYSLSTPTAMEKFYIPHKVCGVFGSSDILVNRDIVVFKSDDFEPITPFKCSVITCAAPDFSGGTTLLGKEGMNRLYRVMAKRIDRIFKAALLSGAENIVLGAFGCGVFSNPPKMVGYIMLKKAQEYAYRFKNIEFAIYSPGNTPNDHRNIDAFMWAYGKVYGEGEKDAD